MPVLKSAFPSEMKLSAGQSSTLTVQADGTAPLEYQWLHDDSEIRGATATSLKVSTSGRYSVLVRNRAGTVVSPVTVVRQAQ